MTSIAVTADTFAVEDRSWLFGLAGPSDAISVTLDLDVGFVPATHWPTGGYMKSGVVLGRITASGLYGPYNDAAVDGRTVAVGILFNTVKIPNLGDLTKNVMTACLIRGSVARLRLPSYSGLNAAGEADMKFIDFADRY